ncbi:MAG TPA: flippase [Gaiellaceae bacterium]|nr:flippase [Gaiellaceae bacterium]
MSPRSRPMLTQLGADARTMAKGAAENVGGALLGTLLSFGLTLLIAHVISPTRFGLYAIALATVMVAQPAAVLGLDVGAVRFVALHAADGDEPGARGSFQVAFAIVALVSALLTAVLFWQAPWLAADAFHKPQAAELIRLVSLALPALALTRVAIGALQGLGLMGYAAWVNPLRVLGTVLSTVPLLVLGLGARGVALAFVPPAWAALAVSLALLLRALPNAFLPSPATWHPRRMLAFSLPQTLTTMLLQVILWTDMLVLGRIRAAAEVAVYAICQRLLSPAQLVSTATGQMFAPRVAAEDARGDREKLGRMLKRVTYWNLAASLPVFALLLVIPGPVLHLFGSAYAAGATALVILAAGQLFNAATGPLGQVINMSGHPYVTLANNAVVAGLNVAGCLILIPRYGIVGAACSTTAAVTIVNVAKLFEVQWMFGINPFRAAAMRTLGLAAAGASTIAAAVSLVVPWPSVLAEVAGTGLALAVAYGFLFWLLAAGDEERALVRRRQLVRPRLSRAASPP